MDNTSGNKTLMPKEPLQTKSITIKDQTIKEKDSKSISTIEPKTVKIEKSNINFQENLLKRSEISKKNPTGSDMKNEIKTKKSLTMSTQVTRPQSPLPLPIHSIRPTLKSQIISKIQGIPKTSNQNVSIVKSEATSPNFSQKKSVVVPSQPIPTPLPPPSPPPPPQSIQLKSEIKPKVQSKIPIPQTLKFSTSDKETLSSKSQDEKAKVDISQKQIPQITKIPQIGKTIPTKVELIVPKLIEKDTTTKCSEGILDEHIVKSLKASPTSFLQQKSFKSEIPPNQKTKIVFPEKVKPVSYPIPPPSVSSVSEKKENIISVVPTKGPPPPPPVQVPVPKRESQLPSTNETTSVTDSESDKVTMDEDRKSDVIRERVVQTIMNKPSNERLQNSMEDFLHDCIIYFLSQILAITVLLLLAAWLMQYFFGFGYQNVEMIFNLHPQLMVFSLIYILANSIVFLTPSKSKSLIRFILHWLMIFMIIVATFATIFWHFKRNVTHMVTLHSWLGSSTLIMAMIYIGFIIYLYYVSPIVEHLDQMILNLRLFGVATLVLASITTLIGMNQMDNFIHMKRSYWNNKSSYRLLVNVLAVFLVVYVVFMVYMAIRRRYRSDEDEELEERIEMAIDEVMEQLEASGTFKSPKPRNRVPSKSVSKSKSCSKTIRSPSQKTKKQKENRNEIQ